MFLISTSFSEWNGILCIWSFIRFNFPSNIIRFLAMFRILKYHILVHEAQMSVRKLQIDWMIGSLSVWFYIKMLIIYTSVLFNEFIKWRHVHVSVCKLNEATFYQSKTEQWTKPSHEYTHLHYLQSLIRSYQINFTTNLYFHVHMRLELKLALLIFVTNCLENTFGQRLKFIIFIEQMNSRKNSNNLWI